MGIGRPSTVGSHRNGVDGPPGQDHAVETGGGEVVHDLFHGHERHLGGQNHFLLHTGDALDEDIAAAIGTLGMDDPHIGTERRNGSATPHP